MAFDKRPPVTLVQNAPLRGRAVVSRGNPSLHAQPLIGGVVFAQIQVRRRVSGDFSLIPFDSRLGVCWG